MYRNLGKELKAKAVALGNAGQADGLPELIELSRAELVQVRRLSASPIGKLAGVADAQKAISPVEPEYIKNGAKRVVQLIEGAIQIQENKKMHLWFA